MPTFTLFDSIVSSLNSALILLAVAHFDYGWSGLRFMHHSSRWTVLVIVFALAATGLAWLLSKLGSTLFKIPDTALALFTLVILGAALYRSFNLRKFGWLPPLTIVALLPTLLATLSVVSLGSAEGGLLHGGTEFLEGITFELRLLYKAALIFLFLSLTTTWAFELAETPPPGCVFLHFTGICENRRWKVEVRYQGIEGTHVRRIADKVYKNLLVFAERRVNDSQGDGGLVTTDDIGGYDNARTYISEQLCYPTDKLFERGDGDEDDKRARHRLSIPPKHITFAKKAGNPQTERRG